MSILAIVGLLAVQTTGRAVAGATVPGDGGASTAIMVMDGMPMGAAAMEGCPGERHAPPPDCGRHCPWAVLCMAACIELGASPALASPVPTVLSAAPPVDDATLDPWSDGPPARPPRA